MTKIEVRSFGYRTTDTVVTYLYGRKTITDYTMASCCESRPSECLLLAEVTHLKIYTHIQSHSRNR